MSVSPPLSSSPAVSNSRGDFLLNGEFVVSMFKREIKVGNAVIEYSGSDHVIERINCTDRIEEEIIVQVTTPYLTVETVMMQMEQWNCTDCSVPLPSDPSSGALCR
jgi:hypothetical protein